VATVSLPSGEKERRSLSSELTAAGAGAGDKSPRLRKAQKRFNELLARVAEQRRELAKWQVYLPAYQQFVAASIVPLDARLRERRIALVKLLDRAMAGPELTRRELAHARELLLTQVSRLLREAPDESLVQVHDQHSSVSFHELRRREIQRPHSRAGAASVADDGDQGDVANQSRTAEDDEQQPPREPQSRRRPEQADNVESARGHARDAVREKAAKDAGHALREVYRKLASELHPDRELDAAERLRKTVLMQQTNRAYAARDLVALLELQLAIQQIHPSALANLAQERLARFSQVLREQSQRLQEEIGELTTPFLRAMGGVVPQRFTPAVVQQALNIEVRELRRALRELEEELAELRDIRRLKAVLKHYRRGGFDAFE
jgi:hypothetical protein